METEQKSELVLVVKKSGVEKPVKDKLFKWLDSIVIPDVTEDLEKYKPVALVIQQSIKMQIEKIKSNINNQ